MRAFLKFMNERVQVCVETGGTASSATIAGVVIPTKISTQTKDELAQCNWNNQGYMPYLCISPPEEFRRASMCEIVKKS